MSLNRKFLWGILIYSILIYFVGNNFLVVTDPVESNYTETALEMLQSGDYFSPRIYGNYWYDKPIMFYWELIAAFKMFGVNDFAVRFFPALFATIGIFLTYFWGRHLYSEKHGLVAAFILGTSVECWYIGHAVITDMTLFVTISGTLMAFYEGYSQKKPCYFYLAFVLAAIAVLTKGPIGLCLPGLIILIFLGIKRQLKVLVSYHILLGAMLFFIISGIWYYPMYLMHGMDFIDTFLGVHNALRATVSEHPRDNVWYFYLLVYLAGLLPWSIISLPAIIRRLWRRDVHWPQNEITLFLLVWAITVFGVFQLFATKYVTYTLPYMVPAALLLARYFVKHMEIFRFATIFMTVFYLAAVFFIAPPLMEKNSGKDMAAYLKTVIHDDDIVLSYDRTYSASLVYYSGIEVKKLATAETIAKERPAGISWNSTNVMPFMAIEDIKDTDKLLVVTNEKDYVKLQQELPGNWHEAGRINGQMLVRRSVGE